MHDMLARPCSCFTSHMTISQRLRQLSVMRLMRLMTGVPAGQKHNMSKTAVNFRRRMGTTITGAPKPRRLRDNWADEAASHFEWKELEALIGKNCGPVQA
jgi:hypothetical protein